MVGKARSGAAIALAVLLALSACGDGASSSEESSGGLPMVVAAFYPLEFIASQIAGDHVTVTSLTPAGVEPHDLELNAGQVASLLQTDLLVYVGQGFQPAVEDLLDQLEGQMLDVLEDAELIEGKDEHADEEDEHADEEDEHADEEDEHEESGLDPHVWLDPTRMVQIAQSVQQRLATLDPDHAGDFQTNTEQLVEELNTLDQEFEDGLAECDRRQIVTSHTAFGYLAARYNLEQHGIAGLDPEAEPSPQRLAEVSQLVKEEGLTTVFFETLLPQDLADTIARETGTTTAVLDPLEGKPASGDYLSTMRANLGELRKALSCN